MTGTMDVTERMAAFCAERNATFRRWMERDREPMETLIREQAEKVRRNRRLSPPLPPEDFYARVRAHIAERLGSAAAERTEAAVRLGAVSTADHHGGLFCAQTFQGNLLFGEIVRELGGEGDVIPIMPGGQVELDSSTYARGICVYADPERKEHLPMFSDKPRARIACCAPAVGEDLIRRFRERFVAEEPREALRGALDSILREAYETEAVLGSRRFEDQVTRIGAALVPRLFRGGDGPLIAYMEMETLTKPMLAEELRRGESPLAAALADPAAREWMNRSPMPGGTLPAQLLFRTADAKGRKVLLTLTEANTLEGRDWHGQPVSFPADPESLAGLLEKDAVIPGPLAIAAMTFFERGVTWLGGVFQTLYLPEWQQATAALFRAAGRSAAAETAAAYDCTGYTCGPMTALWQGDGWAVPAGPVEFRMAPPDRERFTETLRKTGIGDAHRIGLAEMFFDLSAKDERPDGWYRDIGEALYRRFPENVTGYE